MSPSGPNVGCKSRICTIQTLLITAIVQSPMLLNASDPRVLSVVGSERATQGAGNKIVTFGGKTHVVWQEATSMGYFNMIRTVEHAGRKWIDSVWLNQSHDNHARPVVTIDHQGYLHVVMSGHEAANFYRHSMRPNDSSEWTEMEEVGAGTYPSIVCGPDDTLYLTVRAEGWAGADFYVRPKDGGWEKRAIIIKRADRYSGYAEFTTGLAMGRDGVLHVVCHVYEGVGGAHESLCYMRSRDGGRHWEKADGSAVTVPARPEQMDLLVDDSSPRLGVCTWPWIISRGSLVTDSRGRPYVAYISHIEKPGEAFLATTAGDGRWTNRPILAAERAYPRMRPIGGSLALSITADDALYLLMEFVPLDDGWAEGKPLRLTVFRGEPVKRLVLLVSRDRGKTFGTQSVVKPGSMFNMANLERPTGVNTLPAGRTPPIIYFDGTCRNPKEGEVINNDVYFVHSK